MNMSDNPEWISSRLVKFGVQAALFVEYFNEKKHPKCLEALLNDHWTSCFPYGVRCGETCWRVNRTYTKHLEYDTEELHGCKICNSKHTCLCERILKIQCNAEVFWWSSAQKGAHNQYLKQLTKGLRSCDKGFVLNNQQLLKCQIFQWILAQRYVAFNCE